MDSIDLSSLISSTRRVSLIGWALADLAKEGVSRGEFEDFEVVVGLDFMGLTLALVVADELGKTFSVLRVVKEDKVLPVEGFSTIEKKNVLVVTDIVDYSKTHLIEDLNFLKRMNIHVSGLVCIIEKGERDRQKVKVKSLIKV
ncbi:MAG: hypothetical protein ACKD6N_01735 [Candidatus Bathyarchaeota archaeon]